MKQMRCKACGYIMKEEKVGDICPACGVPSSSFEPYEDNLSPRRDFILNLNLHPIAVHFPQALAIFIPFFIILGSTIQSDIGTDMLVTARMISLVLPFTVISALIAGTIDGRTRFKKLTTPILKKKIFTASLLLLLSIIIFIVSVRSIVETYETPYTLLAALCFAAIVCEIILGELGKRLLNARLPG